MKNRKSIRLKGILLAVVFGLNIVVGFACSIGFDMGFNSHHECDECTRASKDDDADCKDHKHKDADGDHCKHESRSKKDNCCNDKVVKISATDQVVPQPYADVNALFFASFVTYFYHYDVLFNSHILTGDKYFARNYHPPIADLRISIQSFLI